MCYFVYNIFMRKFILASITPLLCLSLFSCTQGGGKEPEHLNPDPEPVAEKFDGYEIKNDSASRPTSGIQPFYIYGINDFHGAIKDEKHQMGLGYLGSYMKQKTSEINTLFIDSGDSWQGSLESNFNKGALINEVFEEANLSVRTVGNHDFDWGVDALASNVKNSTFPNLAANVYDYDWNSKKAGDNQQEQFGKSYATYVLNNGLKIGIIGTIGEEQITSISTQLVQNITFTNQLEITKEISDFLRSEKGCDIVVLSTHASFDQVDSESLTEVSTVTNKRYVDLVLNAHTHQDEIMNVNHVSFAQFGGYGEMIGKVTMYYNFETNQLVDSSTTIDSYSSAQIKSELEYKIDGKIQSILDKYDAETKNLGSQVLSTHFSGSFYSNEQLPNLMTEAIYKEAVNEGFDIDFAYTNYGRASHYNSTITYSDLYNIFPFDNVVTIIKVKGKNASSMLKYQYQMYKEDPSIQINQFDTYTVACLDYLAFHCDSQRNYDYFSGFEIVGYLTKNNKSYEYRDILKDYLLNNPDKTFESSYYSFTNPIFAREEYQN